MKIALNAGYGIRKVHVKKNNDLPMTLGHKKRRANGDLGDLGKAVSRKKSILVSGVRSPRVLYTNVYAVGLKSLELTETSLNVNEFNLDGILARDGRLPNDSRILAACCAWGTALCVQRWSAAMEVGILLEIIPHLQGQPLLKVRRQDLKTDG